jgi:hypothetical protein
VLLVLYDDTGCAAWSPYGGRIEMPTLQRLADGGLTHYPGTAAVPERSAANVHAVSYTVLADVEFTPESQGVIFAHGSRFGGHALERHLAAAMARD